MPVTTLVSGTARGALLALCASSDLTSPLSLSLSPKVPSFAKSVVTHNANGDTPVIPLKGFAVGNAWTVAELDNIGAVEYWYTRAMIDNATRNGIYAVCNMSDIGPLLAQRASPRASRVVRAASDAEVAMGVNVPARPLGFTPLRDGSGVPALHNGDDCDTIVNAAFNNLGGIDIYDSFVDVCPSKAVAPVAADSNNNAAGCATTYDPCRDDKTTTYLNTPSVKTAIHANMNITCVRWTSLTQHATWTLTSKPPLPRNPNRPEKVDGVQQHR